MSALHLHPVPDGLPPDDDHQDVDPFIDADDDAPQDTGPAYQLTDGPANVRWLRTELGTSNMPGVFLRGGRLVFVASIGTEGYIPPRHSEDDNGPATVSPMTAIGLSTRIGDHYAIEKWDAKAKKAKPAHFPNDDCQRIMETVEQCPHVRVLKGVTHTPIARATDGILTEAGYDEESQYLHEPNVSVESPAVSPSPEQVANATAFLRKMVADFAWGDEHSEANFFGALLTPLMRLATPAPYKLVAITARERGSGKSLLAEVMRIVHGGSLSTWPSNDDELEKFISSTLHCTTAPVVQVDNVRGTLASGRLEALATSNTYSARILGSTNKTPLANDRLWVFTGNNMVIGGDLGRRMLWIDIDPQVEKPELRTGFSIPDLPRWVQLNRGRILKALLTWIAAWDAAGRPKSGDVTSDSYGTWIASVRSILELAGVPGTFDSQDTERDAAVNPDEMEWGEFLAAVHDVYGDGKWTAKDLCDEMHSASQFPAAMGHESAGSDGDTLREALPSELYDKVQKGGPRSIKRGLGMWLAFRKGQWHNGYTVREAGTQSGTKSRYWTVIHREQ